jgi:hypothetical protein
MPTRNVVFSIKHQKKENSPHCRCPLHTQALESFPVTRKVFVNYFGLEIFPLKVVTSEKVGVSRVTSTLGALYGGMVMGVLLSFDEAAILYGASNIASL